MPRNKSRFFARYKWFFRIVLLFVLWILVHLLYITIDGMNDQGDKADVAIILGNTVYADGTLSPWLKGRVDAALKLYREGRVKKIFASGGTAMSKEEGMAAEGNAMKRYLVAQGVPEGDVIADNQGSNTYLTAKNFIEWNRQYHYTSAIVVSQFYHITRTKYILRKLGFSHLGNATSRVYTWTDVVGTLREVPAFYKYVLVY